MRGSEKVGGKNSQPSIHSGGKRKGHRSGETSTGASKETLSQFQPKVPERA